MLGPTIDARGARVFAVLPVAVDAAAVGAAGRRTAAGHRAGRVAGDRVRLAAARGLDGDRVRGRRTRRRRDVGVVVTAGDLDRLLILVQQRRRHEHITAVV